MWAANFLLFPKKEKSRFCDNAAETLVEKAPDAVNVSRVEDFQPEKEVNRATENTIFFLFLKQKEGDNFAFFCIFVLTQKTKKKQSIQQFSVTHTPFFLFFFPFLNQKGRREEKKRGARHPIEIWLILPVVICLFQGLSHACLRITALQESAHGSLHQT